MQKTHQTKNILITGCSGYLGSHIAKTLLARGFTIWGTTRDRQKAITISKEIHWLEIDLKEKEKITEELSSIPKDIAFFSILHCAGCSPDHTVLNLSSEAFEEAQNVNFTSAAIINRFFLNRMLQPSSILHFGSRVGVNGNIGQIAYSSAKSILLSYVKILAQEIGTKGITVNLIYPGVHDSAILGAHAEQVLANAKQESYLSTLTALEDVINGVLFLLSAHTISGQVFALESRPL